MTARKGKFYVSCSAPTDFPTDQELAVFVRLVSHWADRWAREGWSAARAQRIDLAAGTVLAITGKRQLPAARKVLLLVLRKCHTCEVTSSGEVTSLFWPKLPEIQGWVSLERARRESESAAAAAEALSEQERRTPTESSGDAPRRRANGSDSTPPWAPLRNLLPKDDPTVEPWLAERFSEIRGAVELEVSRRPQGAKAAAVRAAAWKACTLRSWNAYRRWQQQHPNREQTREERLAEMKAHMERIR